MRKVLTRIKRLEHARTVEASSRPPKLEFAYLKLLPRDYTGPRHIVTVGRRPDGGEQCEERAGPPPPCDHDHEDPNVMTVYFVSASQDERLAVVEPKHVAPQNARANPKYERD